MLATYEKVHYLKRVELFTELVGEDLVDIALVADYLELDEATEIIREGDFGEELYIVVKGEVRVFREDLDLATMGPGRVFGEIAILDRQPRTASVAASSPVALLRIRRDDFMNILRRNPVIARGILRVLCERLRNENIARRRAAEEKAEG